MRTPTHVEFLECWSEAIIRNGIPPAVVDDPIFRKTLVITSLMGQTTVCMVKGTAHGKKDTTLSHRHTFTRKIIPVTDKRLDEENSSGTRSHNRSVGCWIRVVLVAFIDKSYFATHTRSYWRTSKRRWRITGLMYESSCRTFKIYLKCEDVSEVQSCFDYLTVKTTTPLLFKSSKERPTEKNRKFSLTGEPGSPRRIEGCLEGCFCPFIQKDQNRNGKFQ